MRALDLRPQTTFKMPQVLHTRIEEEFRFSREPIVCERENLPSDIDSGEETPEEDHETRILSSWHHRALLGDEHRLLYTDGMDTDFDAIEAADKERDAESEE